MDKMTPEEQADESQMRGDAAAILELFQARGRPVDVAMAVLIYTLVRVVREMTTMQIGGLAQVILEAWRMEDLTDLMEAGERAAGGNLH